MDIKSANTVTSEYCMIIQAERLKLTVARRSEALWEQTCNVLAVFVLSNADCVSIYIQEEWNRFKPVVWNENSITAVSSLLNDKSKKICIQNKNF
jgi:hypothetical protein